MFKFKLSFCMKKNAGKKIKFYHMRCGVVLIVWVWLYGWKTEHAKHADDRASKQHKYI